MMYLLYVSSPPIWKILFIGYGKRGVVPLLPRVPWKMSHDVLPPPPSYFFQFLLEFFFFSFQFGGLDFFSFFSTTRRALKDTKTQDTKILGRIFVLWVLQYKAASDTKTLGHETRFRVHFFCALGPIRSSLTLGYRQCTWSTKWWFRYRMLEKV